MPFLQVCADKVRALWCSGLTPDSALSPCGGARGIPGPHQGWNLDGPHARPMPSLLCCARTLHPTPLPRTMGLSPRVYVSIRSDLGHFLPPHGWLSQRRWSHMIRSIWSSSSCPAPSGPSHPYPGGGSVLYSSRNSLLFTLYFSYVSHRLSSFNNKEIKSHDSERQTSKAVHDRVSVLQ